MSLATGRWRVAVATLFMGCAVRRPLAYQSAIAAGDRSYTAGRMTEAVGDFDRAALATTLPRDRDEATYLAAGAAWRAGDLQGALTRYDGLANALPPGERAPRAALEAARIRRDGHMAGSELLTIVRRFPTTGPARRALELLLEDTDTADPTLHQSITLLDTLAADPALAELQDVVLTDRARRLQRAGDLSGAVAGYRRLLDAVPYPRNVHWDDGGLALVQLLRTLGDARGAVTVADRVLAVREVSYGNGDYEAPRFGELAMLRARILRDDLHDATDAIRAFHFVYASFVSSLLRDDALWEEAATRTATGDLQGACGVYLTLATEFPCTHYGRESVGRVVGCGHPAPTNAAHDCERGSGRVRER